MIEVSRIIDYVECVANSYLSGISSHNIKNKIDCIRKKQRDEKLYLAVVGEFNSGKSTFINALLGTRILKEAVMPTTACATYIYNKGNELCVRVRFFDNQYYKIKAKDFYGLQRYIFTKYGQKCYDIYSIIDALTSVQVIAKDVKELEIDIPNSVIPRNVVIIDTPGFNPGSDSVDNHKDITKYVVEQIADAALILTSQEQAMSATLSRFLISTMKRCLHRCVYVVTKMDQLQPEYRSDVMTYVKQRIETDLGIPDPLLYGESAITVLPVKQIPKEKENDWNFYQKQFESFKQRLWNYIQVNKGFVISEHVHLLVKEAVSLCLENLQEKEEALRKEKHFIETHRLQDIKIVCADMVNSASKKISAVLNEVYFTVETSKRSSEIIAQGVISKGNMSLITFKDTMLPKIKSIVEGDAQRILSRIRININEKVSKCVEREINNMADVFAAHYKNFPTLPFSGKPPKASYIQFVAPNITFGLALDKVEALASKESKALGKGAAIGAGLGLCFGPLGAFIGALIGGVGGATVGDQSEKMRTSVLPLVKNEISNFYSTLQSKIDSEINSMKLEYIALITKFASEHITKYESSVNGLIMEQQENLNRLSERISSMRNAVRNLGNIQDGIEQDLVILKTKKYG